MNRAAAACAVATGALLGAVVTIGAAPAPSAAAQTAVLAKGKCKRGQVVVKLQGKKSCRPLRTAFPRPRKGDQRLSIIESAMTFDPSALRDRDGKQLASPADLYGSFGPGAYDAVKRELPRALDRLDLLTKQAAGWRVFSARSAATACPSPGTPTRSDSYTSDAGDGVTLTVTSTAGASSSITLALEKGGDGLTVELDLGQCEEQQGFKAASCPTAAGIVGGTYNSYVRTVTTVRKGGVVTHSLSLRIKQLTKLQGQAGEDAKLDSLAIDDAVRIDSALSGSSHTPVSFTATVKRHTRVDMRTGNYDPGAVALLDVSVDVDGVANDAEAVGAVSAKLQESSGKDFAEAVARAIKEYRQREAGWNKPNTCATLHFTPASGTLHLQTGQSGSFTGHVSASRGGTSSGRWRLVGQRNATYAPSSAQGMGPTFSYHVTRAGSHTTISATFRTTSRAGVAEGEWTQGSRRAPKAWIASVNGTARVTCCESDITTTWTAQFRFTLTHVIGAHPGTPETWAYEATSGSVNWNVSGNSGPCTVRGEATTPVIKVGRPGYLKAIQAQLGIFVGSRPLYTSVMTGIPLDASVLTYSGCEGGGQVHTTFSGFLLLTEEMGLRPMPPNARALSGSFVSHSGDATSTYHWRFTAVG
jgi:hypothetical protein